MIAFFFNRNGLMVRLMEALGAALLIATIISFFVRGTSALAIALFLLIMIEYGFIRSCATVRWYRGLPRGSGIELQFRKALVPAGYAMTILLAFYLITQWTVLLGILAFLLAVVAHVNVILLVFHHRDRDPAPVNGLSTPPATKSDNS